MANKRTLSWSTSLRDLRDGRDGRALRAGIREERLRATAGLRAETAMTSWRGRSGRRYVVGVQPLDEAGMEDVTDAVVLAVRRRPDGEADLVDVAAPSPATSGRSRLRWLALMRTRGATEMHIHLLADGEAERGAVMIDLREREGPSDAQD